MVKQNLEIKDTSANYVIKPDRKHMASSMKSKFYFGYSYQIMFNDLGNYNTGTHVVTIGFDFLQAISNCPCMQSRVDY